MTSKLRDRLTITALLALAAALVIGAPLAADAHVGMTPRLLLNSGTRFEPTEADFAAATAILNSDAQLQGITGGQPVSIVSPLGSVYAVTLDDGRKLLSLDILWDDPVTSNGPWVLYICGTKWRRVGTGEWSNLRAIRVSVDLERKEVLSYGVSALASELGATYDSSSWKYRNPCPQ